MSSSAIAYSPSFRTSSRSGRCSVYHVPRPLSPRAATVKPAQPKREKDTVTAPTTVSLEPVAPAIVEAAPPTAMNAATKSVRETVLSLLADDLREIADARSGQPKRSITARIGESLDHRRHETQRFARRVQVVAKIRSASVAKRCSKIAAAAIAITVASVAEIKAVIASL